MLVLLLLATRASFADRLVLSPRSIRTPSGSFRSEWMVAPSAKESRGFLWLPVDRQFEAELAYDRRSERDPVFTGGLTYFVTTPVPDALPGLSVGVRDLLNRTTEGRSGFVALTFRTDNFGDLQQKTPTEVSFGAISQGGGKFFASAVLPFADQFRLLAEHDSVAMSVGLEVLPAPGLAARVLLRDNDHWFSLRWSQSF